MTLVMEIEDGYAAIEAYGPDRSLWPVDYRDGLDALMAEDQDFADYVSDMARIEAMLEDWEMSDSGAEVNWDDLDDEDFDQKPDRDEPQDSEPDTDDEDDEDEGFAPGAGQSDDQPTMPGGRSADDEEEDEETEGQQPDDEEEEDDSQESPTFEIEPDLIENNVSDMDSHFEQIILQELQSDAVRAQWNTYTRDYDKLVDLETEPTDRLDLLDQAVAKSAGPLMKDLRRLIAAQSQVKRIPGMRKGRLHAPNLHRILSGDDRVFTRREESTSLDTAITLNIDCSGSMQGSRLNLSIQTAYALGSVLSRLGIAFECLGFTDGDIDDIPNWREYYEEVQQAAQDGHIIHRYTPIRMFKFKGFEERWVADVQRRFAYCFNNHGNAIGRKVGFGGTPEGCGNEFAARRLLQRSEARKIMITMTDGEPMTSVFNGDYGDVWKRSVDMVKMIEAAGVDLIGIGIQHSKPKQYYSNAIVINQLDEMPVQLMALLKGILLRKRG